MDANVQLLLVADDPLVRASLRAAMEEEGDFELVGDVASDDLANQDQSADVILWDLGWGEGDTNTSLELLADYAGTGQPILAMVAELGVAQEALAAGARGILEREAVPELVAAALRSMSHGLLVIDPNVADELIPSRPSPQGDPIEPLTPRELEVLGQLADGLTNKAIAAALEVSEHTVKFHVNSILRKLGVQSRTEAVVHATRMGLILL